MNLKAKAIITIGAATLGISVMGCTNSTAPAHKAAVVKPVAGKSCTVDQYYATQVAETKSGMAPVDGLVCSMTMGTSYVWTTVAGQCMGTAGTCAPSTPSDDNGSTGGGIYVHHHPHVHVCAGSRHIRICS